MAGFAVVSLLLSILLGGGSLAINVLDGLKTGLVYQFELSTQIQLTNQERTKTVDEQESSAVLFAQLLRWDQDSNKRVLAIWADNCVNAICPVGKQGDGSSGLLQLFSIWRGSRITELLSQTSTTSENWNVLKSVLFHLQYEVETAKLRPAGLCDTHFSEKDPVTRRLDFCRLGDQHSAFGKIMHFTSSFTQTSQYFFDASSKLRQLTIREQYELSTPFFGTAHNVLISQTRVQLIDQSQSTYNPTGDPNVAFDAFVEVLKKENGLHHVGDSIEELFTLSTRPELPPSTYNDKDACGALGGVKALQRLLPSSKTVASLKTLIRLSNHLRSIDETRLFDCLMAVQQSRDALLGPFVNTLAVAGRGLVQRTVFRFLDAHGRADLKKSYFIMLAHNPWPEKVVNEAFKYFEQSVVSDDADQHLALAVAALARRSDDPDVQDRFLKFLGKTLFTCERELCLEICLRALRNLGHPETAKYVREFFCFESSNLANEALESLRSVDPKFWTNETLQELAQIYANECPTGSSDSSCRTIAAELLLKARPDGRWVTDVGAYLLRPLLAKDWQNRQHREIHKYTLAKLRDMSNLDEAYRTAINNGIRDILKNDYDRLAISGFSGAHSDVLADFGFAKAYSQMNMEFREGVLKRSELEVSLKTKNGDKLPLLSFGLFSHGLAAMAGDSEPAAGDSGDPSDGREATAGMRLALLDQVQPPVTFFTGNTELMSAVWAASGEPMTAFEGHFLVNDLRGVVPLANGQKATVDLASALLWKITGAVEISVWYRNAHTTISTQLAYFMASSIEVQHVDASGKSSLRDESTLSTGVAVDFVSDIDFGRSPFLLCTQMNHRPIQLKYRNRQKRFASTAPLKQSWKRDVLRRLPGHCFVTEPNVARGCASVLKHLGRDN